MPERWKKIKGFHGCRVSDHGNVKYFDRETGVESPLKITHQKIGYGMVRIKNNREEKPKFRYVHRLVAKVFCENDNPKKNVCVTHINFDRSNNKADNLKWITPFEKTRRIRPDNGTVTKIIKHSMYKGKETIYKYYLARYIKPDRQRISKLFKTRKEAKKYLSNFHKKYAQK